LLLLLAACKDGYIWPDRGGEPDDPEALSPFATADELEAHLKRAIREQSSGPPMERGDVVLDAQLPVAESGAAPMEPRSGDFSTTNLQEVGVDEADRLKSDGHYLYVLSQEAPDILPLPAEMRSTAIVAPRPPDSRLRVLELGEDSPSAREVASLKLPEGMRTGGSYLLTGREEGEGDLLVVLGRKEALPYATEWFTPWTWRSGKTLVVLFDISDPAAPRQRHLLTFDGHLVASRRIGTTLYLVTRHYPWIRDYLPAAVTAEQKRHNAEVLERATLSDLLPRWRVDDEEWQAYLTSSRSCYLPPLEENRLSADVISIIAIDLRNPARRPTARCLVGPTETLYMSTGSLYLATVRHRYTIQRDPASTREMVVYPPDERTEVHKFALTADGPRYRGSASLQGHLGWEQDKKPFRMGEHEGALFVVTAVGQSWSGDATTRLTVLGESGDGRRLKELAHLPNEKRPEPIGLPGERLYAARFLGELGPAFVGRGDSGIAGQGHAQRLSHGRHGGVAPAAFG